jgi:hypothetical protein
MESRFGPQQFFGGQQVRPPQPQQYLTYSGQYYYPTQTTGGFDMSSMMNMIMMIMMMAIMMSMMKPLMSGFSGK